MLLWTTYIMAVLAFPTTSYATSCNEEKFNQCFSGVVCKHLDCTQYLGLFSDSLFDYFVNETQFASMDAHCSLADEYLKCFGDVKAMDDCTIDKLNGSDAAQFGSYGNFFVERYEDRKLSCMDPEIRKLMSKTYDCQSRAILDDQDRLNQCHLSVGETSIPCSDHQAAVDCYTDTFVRHCGEESRRDLCTILARAKTEVPQKSMNNPMRLPDGCELKC